MNKALIKYAFMQTLPIMAGYLVLGMGFGILLYDHGYSVLWAILMSITIYAGSMQYVAIDLISSGASILTTILMTLMVNARHLFYGISMLEKYKNTGWKKFYLIFGMCDESFTVNCTVDPPEDVDRGWFMFFVNALNQFYWVAGATSGALLGYVIHFNTKGIDFVMTALFVVMFINQWEEAEDHKPALVGVVCSVICLILFGSDSFILPAMASIILCFLGMKKYEEKRKKECIQEG